MTEHRSCHYWRRDPPVSSFQNPPHCVTTKTCDGCEAPFVDSDDLTVPPARFTFPCGHVYCYLCFEGFQLLSMDNHKAICLVCGNCVTRALNNPPCLHNVPVSNFRQSDFVPGKKHVSPPAYFQRVGQTTDEQCQKCKLVTRLQELTRQIQAEVSLWPFPGEIYACVEINGYIIHGMLKEPLDAQVDPVDDTAIPRDVEVLNRIAKELVRILDDSPVEYHFDPKGTLFFSFRARKHKPWADRLMLAEKGLPTHLVPPPVFPQEGVPMVPMSYDKSIPLTKPPKGVPKASRKDKAKMNAPRTNVPLLPKPPAPETEGLSEKAAGERRAE